MSKVQEPATTGNSFLHTLADDSEVTGKGDFARLEDLLPERRDRLALAGEIAPIVRRVAAGPQRRIRRVNTAGDVIGETTNTVLVKSLLERTDIEFGVQEGAKPQYVLCEACKRPIRVVRSGAVPRFCRSGTHKCIECGRSLVGHKGRGEQCRFEKKCYRCTFTRVDEDTFVATLAASCSWGDAARRMGLFPNAVRERAIRLGLVPGQRRSRKGGRS